MFMNIVSYCTIHLFAQSYSHLTKIVRVVDPTNNEAKMKLAEIYEILNEPRKALTLVYEGGLTELLCVQNSFPCCSH